MFFVTKSKTYSYLEKLIACCLLTLISCYSMAETQGFTTTRLAFIQKNFTGEKNTSFSESKSGYGIQAAVLLDSSWAVPFITASLLTLSGQQNFMDGTSAQNLSFQYYQGDFEAGLQVYLIPRRKGNISLYLSAAGIGGFSYISLGKNKDLASIPSSDKAIGGGWAAGCGAEFSFDGLKQWSLMTELKYTSYSATLLDKKFDLGGLSFVIGMGW